ncbi:MAG: serine/threonine-protein kinase [Planctomycetota bacterium]
MSSDPCPTDEALTRVLTSGEADASDLALQRHLDRCEVCQQRLEQIADVPRANDEGLRNALTEGDISSQQLVEVIDRIAHRDTESDWNGAPSYDDLEPWITPSSSDGSETLDGHTLLECIGRGGMGIVFRACRSAHGSIVALKTMLPELARDNRARERFTREARAIASVRHSNVVALYAVSEVEGLPYLLMEHVEGVSLDDRLRGAAPMAADEIVRIGAAVASGIEACHAEGVIHRDIKPSNVLLGDEDDTVKITDFGLAMVASTPKLTFHGYLPGTPDYVAPERLVIDGEADRRSDLFSLGCLLYKMATGHEPFGGDTPLITLHRIATHDPPPVRVKNPSIPAGLAETIAWLMEKRPEDRPASAEVAREALLGNSTRSLRWWRWPRAAAALVLLTPAILFLSASSDWRKSFAEQSDASTSEPTGLAQGADTPPGSQTRILVTEAAELEAAVESIGDGGRIVIDTDATLDVAPLFIDAKSVTLAAAEGRDPTLQLDVPEEGVAPEFLLRAHRCRLTLEGLSFQDRWEAEDHVKRHADNYPAIEKYSLLSLVDAELEVQDCRFETRTHGSCISLESINQALMRSAKMFAVEGTAVALHAADDNELQLTDCVVVGNAALVAELDGEADLVLQNSTLLANIAVLEVQPRRGQLTARVSDCLIQSAQALVVSSLESPSRNAFADILAWYGDSNHILGHSVAFKEGEFEPKWGQEVGDWAVEDRNGTYERMLFTVPHREVVERLVDGQSVSELVLDRPDR